MYIRNRQDLAILRGETENDEEYRVIYKMAGGDTDFQKLLYSFLMSLFNFKNNNGVFSLLSDNTKLSYSRVFYELYEFLVYKYNRVIPIYEITREDASSFVQNMINPVFNQRLEKLNNDKFLIELKVYKKLKELYEKKKQPIEFNELYDWYQNNVNQQDIIDLSKKYLGIERFGLEDQKGVVEYKSGVDKKILTLHYILGYLITGGQNLIKSIPTRTEYARENTSYLPTPTAFTYVLAEPKKVTNSTIATKIANLSAIWSHLSVGENFTNKVLIKDNIWLPLNKKYNISKRNEYAITREEKKIPEQVIIQMLEKYPIYINNRKIQLGLEEKNNITMLPIIFRNYAILMTLCFMGLRYSEIMDIRREKNNVYDTYIVYKEDSPYIHVKRKGNKIQLLPFPQVVWKAILEFNHILKEYVNKVLEHTPEAVQLFDADAPIFPKIKIFGNAKMHGSTFKDKMTTNGLKKILINIAENCGISKEDIKKIHPHGLRHFAAEAMAQGGVNIRKIQQILGHSSIDTTEYYLRKIKAEELNAEAEISAYLNKSMNQPPIPMKKYTQLNEPSPAQDKIIIETTADKAWENIVEKIDQAQPTKSDLDKYYQMMRSRKSIIEAENIPSIVKQEEQQVKQPQPLIPLLPPPEDLVIIGDKKIVNMTEGVQIELFSEKGTKLTKPELKKIKPLEGENIQFSDGNNKWLNDNGYNYLIENFGISEVSRKLWYLRNGKGLWDTKLQKKDPPFPVWSSEQINPSLKQGEWLFKQVTTLWQKYKQNNWHVRATGILRWYGFFVYHGSNFDLFYKKLDDIPIEVIDVLKTNCKIYDDYLTIDPTVEEKPELQVQVQIQHWLQVIGVEEKKSPKEKIKKYAFGKQTAKFINMIVSAKTYDLDFGNPTYIGKTEELTEELKKESLILRQHDDNYLLEWINLNSNNFITTKAEYKNFSGAQEDNELWAIAYEHVKFNPDSKKGGVVPAWFAEDNPLKSIQNWQEFSAWVKYTIIGIVNLKTTKKKKELLSEEERLNDKIKQLAITLDQYFNYITKLYDQTKGESRGASSAIDAIDEIKYSLILYQTMYILQATDGQVKYKKVIDAEKSASRKEAENWVIDQYKAHGIPNPNDKEYRDIQDIQRRITFIISKIVKRPELTRESLFGATSLLEASKIIIDDTEQDIYVKEDAKEYYRIKYQADPDLIVRRALRGIWEQSKQNKTGNSRPDILKTTLYAFLTFVVPSQSQMIEQMEVNENVNPEQVALDWILRFNDMIKELSAKKTGVINLDEDEEDGIKNIFKEVQNIGGEIDTGREIHNMNKNGKRLIKNGAPTKDFIQRAYLVLDFIASKNLIGVKEVKPEKKLMKNGKVTYRPNNQNMVEKEDKTYVQLDKEKPEFFYEADIPTPGGSVNMFYSPGALKTIDNLEKVIEQTIGNPFELIRATL